MSNQKLKRKMVNDLYIKCVKQETDINEEFNKLYKEIYPKNTFDRIHNKIYEKIENFLNTINLLNKSIEYEIISKSEKDLWKCKAQNLMISCKGMDKKLEDFKEKLKINEKSSNFNNNNSFQLGENILNLTQENQCWKNVLKLSSEIEHTAKNVNSELDNQFFSLRNIGTKVSGLLQKIITSKSQTSFIIKREKSDLRLCLFLGFLSFILIYIFFYYFKPKFRNSFHFTIKNNSIDDNSNK